MSGIVVASNRGPVSFDRDERGGLVAQRGAGGLVTALAGVLPGRDATWVAAAMTDGDREVAAGAAVPDAGFPAEMRYVVVPPDRYDAYYNEVANRTLWFAHHYLWDTVRSPVFDRATEQAWEDYVAVNRAFAEELAEIPGDPPFLVQDYHLSLVPRFLRELRPGARIAHFSHTPFAGSTYLRILPARIRDALLRGLLGADVLGFQTGTWAENFLFSARAMPGARVDLARSRVTLDGREVLVRVYPISVEAPHLRQLAQTPEVRKLRREIARIRGDRALLLRVDRLELTKNIVRGFLAYESFLRANPGWRGRVTFLALLSPSRSEIPEYQAYTDECLAEAERINREYGDHGWTPVHVSVREDYPEAVAALGLYDVLLVNPVFDGMNLVAMEGPLLNRRHGALVLSRNAGAFGRLGRYALGVNPFDVAETADAIREALEMPPPERTRRARGLARTVLANTPARWLGRQLDDLSRVKRPG
ncbi:MAG: trehalose-6-phosphate synthase [Actinobacteria bacterium]|nr:trehalose-6-phosphate synthase [Actinomycetota bacterium]